VVVAGDMAVATARTPWLALSCSTQRAGGAGIGGCEGGDQWRRWLVVDGDDGWVFF